MSPVSRSRKPKKKRQTPTGRSGNPASPGLPVQRERSDPADRRPSPFAHPGDLAFLQEFAGARPGRPAWIGPAVAVLLDDGTGVLLGAEGPRELEDLTATLLGAHVHQVIVDRESTAIASWVEALIATAERRIRARPGRGGPGDRAAVLLLHGLTSIGAPGIARAAHTALSRLRRAIDRMGDAEPWPAWLDVVAAPRMTGAVWTMRDVYGSRLAVIAATAYPGGLDEAVYLFDIDACGFVVPVGGGTFDDVEQAAALWRATVGAAAAGSVPCPLGPADTEALRCLVELELGEMCIKGSEPRPVWDEWFRAARRVYDIADALKQQGGALPAPINLYHEVEIEPTVDAFMTWLVREGGEEPDPETVEALVGEWLEGTLPDTVDSVSPHRIEFQLGLYGDWDPDHPVTIGVRRLLPDWVRFLAQRGGLPESETAAALETVAAVSAGGHRAAEHCPYVH